MRFVFGNKKLEALYVEEKGAKKYSTAVVDGFFEVVEIIRAAKDERDIRVFQSLRYEKLKGDRRGQWSLRINDQFRLIVTREKDEQGIYLVIHSIEDYHS